MDELDGWAHRNSAHSVPSAENTRWSSLPPMNVTSVKLPQEGERESAGFQEALAGAQAAAAAAQAALEATSAKQREADGLVADLSAVVAQQKAAIQVASCTARCLQAYVRELLHEHMMAEPVACCNTLFAKLVVIEMRVVLPPCLA
jgi:hypothetical protein